MISAMSDAPSPSSKPGTPMPLGLAGGVMLFAVLGAGFLGWYVTGHERARLSDWIAATITVLAMVTVAVGLVYAMLNALLRRQRLLLVRGVGDVLQARVRRERASRERAAAVAVWYAMETGDLDGAQGVQLRNASDLPVTRVRLFAQHEDVVIGQVEVPVLPPNNEPLFVAWPEDVVQKIRVIQGGADGENRAWKPQISMLFCDAAGVPWLRGRSGSLTELRTEPRS